MSKADLDPMARRLLDLLRADARRTAASLGRELNLSRTAVQDRIARLERDGIIGGYTICEPPADAGHRALASITIEVRPCDPVLRRISSVPGVERVFSLAGDVDAIALVRGVDATAISELADRLSSIEGVGSVTLRTILRER
ncbi:Lrp/AsnC family transcriptional regulator [Pseudoroseicyclus tamaricis]|uniref:Lrp/AsnC family transcriptional regulator n=1 Tax=Pseudoroseicyclus tamaricis TaxID=2705421 RepID=A0A6B2JU26_9RHOB|nr:Lrp/AsnC family transcriptional regulator [Pseudoroseicyclus tamaricis]NDV02047.1 Lrp/AsnC family transcriptional regulator [Pseudoroseicyclus tamaricis]